MRIVGLAALACALGLAVPCAAQTENEQAEPPPRTISVQKQVAAPQLFAPPESLPAPSAPVQVHADPPQPPPRAPPPPPGTSPSPRRAAAARPFATSIGIWQRTAAFACVRDASIGATG